MNHKKFYHRITFQITLSVVIFIALIEFILLVLSVQKKETEFSIINEYVITKVQKENNIKINPPFDEEYIKMKLDEFAFNITMLTLLIIAFVSIGTIIIFNYIGIRHIKTIIRLNQNSTFKKLLKTPDDKIPSSELGEIMIYRNELLDRIQVSIAKQSSLASIASTIAHEINTPLTVISSNIQLAQKELGKENPDLEKAQLKVSRVNDRIFRLKQIIKGIYILAKDDLKNETPKIFSINEVIEDTSLFARETTQLKSVKLEFSLPQEKIMVEGHSYQLFQVFLNFIKNACDAIKEQDNPWIKIVVSYDEANCKVNFIDSGTGIPADVKEKIFNNNFSTKGVGNLGLGLGLCIKLAQENNAKINITEVDGHTCFQFTIPLKEVIVQKEVA